MILSSLSPVINTFACNWSEKLSGEAPGVSDSDALMMGVMVMEGTWWHYGPQWGHGSPLCYLPVCQCQYLDCINRPTDLHANYVPTSPFCTLRICSASGHLFLACHKWGILVSRWKDQILPAWKDHDRNLGVLPGTN